MFGVRPVLWLRALNNSSAVRREEHVWGSARPLAPDPEHLLFAVRNKCLGFGPSFGAGPRTTAVRHEEHMFGVWPALWFRAPKNLLLAV